MLPELIGFPKDAECLFEHLKTFKAKIDLTKSSCEEEIISAIQRVLDQYEDDFKDLVLRLIAYTVLKELFKSFKIDLKIISHFLKVYPNCHAEDAEPDWVDDFTLRMRDIDPNYIDEEDVDVGDGEVTDDDDDDYYEYIPSYDPEEVVESVMIEFGEAGLKAMEDECAKMGCSLMKGQEEQILRELIDFAVKKDWKVCDKYVVVQRVKYFMEFIKGYVASFCILKDAETVHRALEHVDLQVYADYRVAPD